MWKEINILFNNALNPFYLSLCAVGHWLDHSDNDKETNIHHFLGYYFQLTACYFYIHYHT